MRLSTTASGLLAAIAFLSISCQGCSSGKKPPNKPSDPASGAASEPNAAAPIESTMVITSAAFDEGKPIPRRHCYRGEGENISPSLAFSGPPAGTAELALIMNDPDAPVGDWTHWVVYKIPAAAIRLKEGIPQTPVIPDLGACQGLNSWREIGYGGPMPPPGKTHRYIFTLYALDAELDVKPGLDAGALLSAMEGHILATAVASGTYRR